MWKLLFAISSVKILTIALELTSRRKIGDGFGAEIGLLFCFSAEFNLSNNAKQLFFNGFHLIFLLFMLIYLSVPCGTELLTVPVGLAVI